MSLADFLAREFQQALRHEFYRGETFAMADGSARQNRVILNLASRVAEHLEGSRCQVFAEAMKLQIADEAVLYPDVMVTCGSATAGDQQIVTDPTLIIEVLSASTKGYDRRNKFALYRRLPALREYVLVDPTTRDIEAYRLTPNGWLLSEQSGAGDLVLCSIDARVPMAAIFRGVAAEGD